MFNKQRNRSKHAARAYQREFDKAKTAGERIAINHSYTLDGEPVTDVLMSCGQHTYGRVHYHDGVWAKQCGTETCPYCSHVYASELKNCPHCLAHNECYETVNPSPIVTAAAGIALIMSLGALVWAFVS